MKNSKHSVLLVEDEEGVRQNIAQYLRLQDIHVLEAENGKIAFELYEDAAPDLILTDVSMPVMDGLTLIEKIRDIDEEVSIVVLSAHSEKEKLFRAVKLKLVDYVIKPITRANLKALLKKTLYSKQIIDLGCEYTYDMHLRVLKKENKAIELSLQQTQLMHILVRNKGHSVSSEDIFFEIKDDYSLEYNSASIRNMIKRVRILLPKGMIKNIYGGGYVLNSVQEREDLEFSFYDTQDEAVIIYNSEHQIVYANEAMFKIFHYETLQELQNRTINSFTIPIEYSKLEEAEKLDEQSINKIHFKRKDSSLFLAKVHSKCSYIDGMDLRVLSISAQP
ncbi:MAG: response regulator [Campylobacterota bacterium]|nr:response regulator [Campylobacterota bacterium]